MTSTRPAFPGGTSVSRLKVYDWPAPDGAGLAGSGTPHLHTASAEGYVVVGGRGSVQTLGGGGFAEHELRPGSVVWFTPGVVHRLVNDGDLEIVVVMSNAGLPEAGDAVLTFPPDVLADPQRYREASTLPAQDEAEDDEAVAKAARARRDLALEGYAALRDRVDREGGAGLADLHAAAARLVSHRVPEWRDIVHSGPEQTTAATVAALAALAEGDGSHLSGAVVAATGARPGPPRYGMCGRLQTFDLTSTSQEEAPVTRRYAIVGTGHRVEMYVDALLHSHADAGELVALCDPNRTRIDYYLRRCAESGTGRPAPAAYDPSAFEEMLDRERPEVLIVTTVDRLHAQYVIAGLERGLDVLCEKPLTIDEEGCRAIAEAAAASTGELVMTFNYRYSPRNSVVKQMLLDGTIGQVTSVHFEWVLDTVHGADYFRRWHRQKANGGGLLVHKAAHHFDLVNWWLSDTPDTVAALGRRAFYGPGTPAAARRDHLERDPFALDLADDPRLEALYGEAAHAEDGYVRNQDVFAEGVDIEDNMALVVGYEGGPLLSYSLNAHAPWEGYNVAFNGTEGRLELTVVERADVAASRDAQVVDPSARPDLVTGAPEVRRLGTELVLQRHWQPARRVDVPESDTGHGGGDELLLDHLFRGADADPLGLRADYRDGIRSVLVGAAANRSIAEQRIVRVSGLGVPAWAYRVGAPDPDPVATSA